MSSNDEVASLQESISNIKLEIENDVKSSTAFDADAMTMDQVSRCTVAVFFFFCEFRQIAIAEREGRRLCDQVRRSQIFSAAR